MANKKSRNDMTKDERICDEIDRLRGLFKIKTKKEEQSSPPKLRVAIPLINRAAWLRATIEDLEKKIDEEGCVEGYKNGENQHGIKVSAASNAHDSKEKLYNTIMKQLCELAPENSDKDELQDFCKLNK
ncbi:hypothetical protein [Caproicibacterium sp. BJN0003]|uniref:hypothetical protein n=1 Tax=Caproicibacterium sp. BJN0003 TaxID=2994078 RepID=UPI002257B8E3|nr:hypothetical protein [Caproicibacterium sp. BJN0003]UZT82137.1 hypothetical protein OP489_11825 [Caproicibacterium sp. BJN0003]